MLLFLLAVLCLLVYIWCIKPLKYWEKKGVKCVKSIPIFGSIFQNVIWRKSIADFIKEAYDTYPDERYVGFYQFRMPTLLLKDPDLLKQICIRDFEYFPEHMPLIAEDADPLWSKNLLAMRGPKWRELRPTLSPCFTTSKMRAMYGLMSDCAKQFARHFLEDGSKTSVVEMKEVFTRYGNDVIATCAFGVTCDSLKEKENEFYVRGRDATDFSGLKGLKFFGHTISPTLMKLLNVKIFNEQTRRFFTKVVTDTIALRQKNGLVRPDVINIMMEARRGKQQEEDVAVDTGFATVEESEYGKAGKQMEITDEDIAAQALIFFVAGFEMVATLMSFTAYELAINPDVQRRLYEEVRETYQNAGGNVSYEALMGMKYMDMVVSETVRKWPPNPASDRHSVRPYVIPAKNPGEKPLELPTGSVLWLPIYAIQRDPKYFPNPDRFDPERFSDESRGKINRFTYPAFGIGPRNCIGSRFALLESKTIMFHVLLNFEIVPVERTPVPIVFSPKHFNVHVKGGIWLGFKRRKPQAY